MKENPEYNTQHLLNDELIIDLSKELWKYGMDEAKGSGDIYTIPVVVHVIHHPSHAEGYGTNIPLSQIQAGVEYLTDAFRNTGEYFPTEGADVGIEFCLASIAPDGTPTDGVTRHGSYTYLETDMATEEPAIKSDTDSWDTDYYMNIWLVEEICNSESTSSNPCGTAGYSYYPTAAGAYYDGIVSEHQFFGVNANDTKVVVHEVGHYLNLYHTFQGGCSNSDCASDGDKVCDTPPDGSSTPVDCDETANSCTSDDDDSSLQNPYRPLFLGGLGDQNDMTDNYMDYNYRSCQTGYTAGQSDRMRLTLETIRASLLSSIGCSSSLSVDAGISNITSPSGYSCSDEVPVTVTLTNYGVAPLTSVTIEYSINGSTDIYQQSWDGYLTTSQSSSILLATPLSPSAGGATVVAYTTQPNGMADENLSNDEESSNFVQTYETQYTPSTSSFESGSTEVWVANNLDASNTWENANIYGCDSKGTHAIKMDNFSYSDGYNESDNLVARYDLSDVAVANLSFDLAYAQRSALYPDRLKVQVSTNCGASYQTLYDQQGGFLSTTAGYYTSAWAPTTCSDWTTVGLDLTEYVGQEIMILFNSISKGGNNLYLDNIQVNSSDDAPCLAPEFSISNITYTSAQIFWPTIDDTQTYELRYKSSGSSTYQGYYEDVNPPFVIIGLEAGSFYDVEMRSICEEGTSAWKDVSFNTELTDCVPPSGLSIDDVDATSIDVSWNPVADVGIYIFQYSDNGGVDWETEYVSETAYSLTGLATGVNYLIQIQSVCGGATSFIYGPIEIYTEQSCDPPSDLVVTDVSLTSITAELALSDDAISYVFEHRKLGDIGWSNAYTGSNIHTINDLEPDTHYELRMKSVCPGITGEPTPITVVKTVGPCAAPLYPQIIEIGDDHATLAWQGSAEIDSVRIRYREIDGFWQQINVVGDSYLLEGLDACKAYEFKIRSFCPDQDPSTYGETINFETSCGGYCSVFTETSEFDWIESVTIGTYTNISGQNGGFGDFSDEEISLTPGNSINISLTAGVDRKAIRAYWDIWVDMNHNGEFEEEELILTAGDPLFGVIYESSPTILKNVVIPDWAEPGTTRMRVALQFDQHASPCEDYTFGEVEDYTIIIND